MYTVNLCNLYVPITLKLSLAFLTAKNRGCFFFTELRWNFSCHSFLNCFVRYEEFKEIGVFSNKLQLDISISILLWLAVWCAPLMYEYQTPNLEQRRFCAYSMTRLLERVCKFAELLQRLLSTQTLASRCRSSKLTAAVVFTQRMNWVSL